MHPILENLTGTAALTDQIIATDLLQATNSSIQNYALALTESISPDVRKILRQHLEEQIYAQEKLVQLMRQRGWYHTHARKQIGLDMDGANTALDLQ